MLQLHRVLSIVAVFGLGLLLMGCASQRESIAYIGEEDEDDPVVEESGFGEDVGNFFAGIGDGVAGVLGLKEKVYPAVTKIEVTRFRVETPSKEPEKLDPQTLVLDLETGRATFTDIDGRSYPQQLPSGVAGELQDALHARTWKYAEKLEKQEESIPVVYEMVVYEGGEPVKDVAVWTPSSEKSPEQLDTIISQFDRSHRLVYPMSNYVNLLSRSE